MRHSAADLCASTAPKMVEGMQDGEKDTTPVQPKGLWAPDRGHKWEPDVSRWLRVRPCTYSQSADGPKGLQVAERLPGSGVKSSRCISDSANGTLGCRIRVRISVQGSQRAVEL